MQGKRGMSDAPVRAHYGNLLKGSRLKPVLSLSKGHSHMLAADADDVGPCCPPRRCVKSSRLKPLLQWLLSHHPESP